MEKTRRLKTFSIVALIVAVLGLTIAFAALSKTLTINGTGTVDAANWDIHFKNISEASLTGKATTTGTPSLADNGATINDMKVSLKEPGDKVVYTVDIENSGDINAEIDSIVLPTLTTAQSNILDFKAVYTSNNKEIKAGDILAAKEVKNVTITIMYKDITDESLLPKEGININLNYELHFVQTDKASGSSSQGGNNPSGALIKNWDLSDTITMTYFGGIEQQDGTYEGGTVVISGTGTIPNPEGENFDQFTLNLLDASSTEEVMSNVEQYFNTETETFNYKYKPVTLIIDEGITGIGSNALMSSSITSITLPSSVTTIEDSAFDNFTALHDIRIPAEPTLTIGTYMFENTPVEEIYIAASKVNSIPIENGSSISYFNGIEGDYTIYCKYQSAIDDIINMTIDEWNPTSYVQPHLVLDPTKFD